MNKDEKTAVAIAAVGLLGVVSFAVDVFRVSRIERDKRKQIKTWEQEQMACIANAQKRLEKMIHDGGCTPEDFWQAYYEEFTFLDQIRGPRPF